MKTILLIDDQASVLQTLTWLLESKGYRCLNATTSEEAEEVFRNNDVDAAIVDHGLPGVDGTTLALRLKSIRNVPVVMFSGNPEVNPAAGTVDLFLAKPQPPESLLKALAQLLG